ncbi:MAG: 2OG-Fe dioxygenase family protein [Cyanobacteria bacterium P01_G01_bin.49]
MPSSSVLTTVKNAIRSQEISKNPLALTMPLLEETEASDLILSCGELGPDPSSDYFTTRTKNLAYVLCLNGAWFQIRADFFVQPQQYNDFSGGYKRCYREMPKEFLDCDATKKVLNAFKSTYNIPDNEPILVQVQKSHVTTENAGQCLTGQGIHSDGADRAILVCLERNNIKGAKNAIYGDLEGKQALINPFVLKEGHAMLWHDNQVFHDVQPAQGVDLERESSRTVLIAHYPAIHYLTGTINPNNSLGTKTVAKSRQLRLRISQN